jgi:arsenite-transporting ATPase
MPSPDRRPDVRPMAGAHWISADLPELGCRLVLADQRASPSADPPPVALDLSGEQVLAARGLALEELRSFEAVPMALRLWEGLRPRVEEWLRLLELADREVLLLPPLPGVDVLLQCLFLAEQLEELEASRQRMTVLLPPPGPAMALLELARTGPELVEGLLDPLLRWWDQTRLSLGGLGKLVGLDLPTASSLRLEEGWRRRLEHLARELAEPGPQLTLCLEAADGEGRVARHRLSRLALRGPLPTRLLLHGEGAPGVKDDLSGLLEGAVVVSSTASVDALAEVLRQTVGGPSRMAVDAEAGTLTLPLPGLRREELQVRQVRGVIVLLCGGHRRLVPLPPPLERRKCVGAHLEGGRLALRFQEAKAKEAPAG